MRPKPLTADQIRDALEQCNRNYQAAAALLGKSPSSLYDRIKRLRAEGHEFPRPIGHIRRAESFYCPDLKEIERVSGEIRAGWPPSEHAKRARWAHCGEYEIPQVALEDDTRDDIW